MHSQQNIYSGRAAEFYAAYILETMGLRTTHVDLPFDDLWVRAPDQSIKRVQVKSASKPHARKDHKRQSLVYNFKIDRKEPYEGIFVFVALDIQKCIARTWDDKPPSTFKITPARFIAEDESDSIKREFNL